MAAQENSRDLPEEPLHLDDVSLEIVADLVRFYLPSRELVRLQLVSKEWRTWCSQNAKLLWTARKQDATSLDWYFPTRQTRYQNRPYPALEWHGLHHPSGQEHRLPDLAFLSNRQVKILASASGLLLLHTWNWPEETPLTSRILVCNPSTKKWRHLPHYNHPVYCPTTELEGGDFIHIVVDDESNTYEVVLVKRLSICTYNSQTNQWRSTALLILPKWVTALRVGSICSNGRIYVLQVEGGEDDVITVRAYLGDQSQLPDAVYTLNARRRVFGGARPRGPALVACLGDVYAVVPVIENLKGRPSGSGRRWRLFPSARTSVTGTVRFEVFQLLEEGKKFAFCATLPLQVELRMGFRVWASFGVHPWSWYRCAAQGAVIWLACQDQLLQFDVVTRYCKTETVQLGSVGGEFDFCVPPYEPNFHVTP